jgi:hypothetical protein
MGRSIAAGIADDVGGSEAGIAAHKAASCDISQGAGVIANQGGAVVGQRHSHRNRHRRWCR